MIKGKLKGPKEMVQMVGKRKLREHKAGFYYN
jgi:hypothetical protein